MQYFSTIITTLRRGARMAHRFRIPIIAGLVVVAALAPAGIAWGDVAGVGGAIITGLLAGPEIAIAVGILSALNALGLLLFTLVMAAFMYIITIDFSDFFAVGSAVDTVWRVMRDLSNMFFIIVMMAIAFGTMLKLESYKWQRMLPKLALMAILINFSKTIALIILDAGQVLMMTFVNAFHDIALDNIITGTRLFEPFAMGLKGGLIGPIAGLISMAMTTIMVYTTMIVMLVILLLLLFRMALLWVFIAISPAAYITNILDVTKKHASRWWSMYLKLVLFGPCLAFFLWFTFLFMASGEGVIKEKTLIESVKAGNADIVMNRFGASNATSPYNFTNFLIGIILLIVGTGMAIQSADIVGGIGQKAATGLLGWGKKRGDDVRMKVGKHGLSGVPVLGKFLQNQVYDRLGKTRLGKLSFASRAEAQRENAKKRTGKAQQWSKFRAGVYGGIAGLGKLTANGVNIGVLLSVPEPRKEWFRLREQRRQQKIISPAQEEAGALEARFGTQQDVWGTVQSSLRNIETKLDELERQKKENEAMNESQTAELGKKDVGEQIEQGKTLVDALVAALKDSSGAGENFNLAQVKNFTSEGDFGTAYKIIDPVKQKELWGQLEYIREVEKNQKQKQEWLAKPEEHQTELINAGNQRKNRVYAEYQNELNRLRLGGAGGAIFDTKEIERRQDHLSDLVRKEVSILQQLVETIDDKERKKLEGNRDKNHAALRELGYGPKMEAMLSTIEGGGDSKDIDDKSKFAGDFKKLEEELNVANNKQLAYSQLKGKSIEQLFEEYDDLDVERKNKVVEAESIGDTAAASEVEKAYNERLQALKATFAGLLGEEVIDVDAIHRKVKGKISGDVSDVRIQIDLDKIGTDYFQSSSLKESNKEVYKEYEERRSEKERDAEMRVRAFERAREYEGEEKVADTWHQDPSKEKNLGAFAANETKIKEVNEKIEKVKEKIAGWQTDEGYIRRLHEWSETQEEKKKIMTDDSEELIRGLKIAEKRGNKVRVSAFMHKLAEDTNFNDLLQDFKMPANLQGMQQFGRRLIKNLKLSEQEAFGLMKDISDILRHGDHWSMAYSHITKDGKYVEATPLQQMNTALNMMQKSTPSDRFRRNNRLAFGWNDPITGKFKFTPHGLAYMLQNGKDMAFTLGRSDVNLNLLMNLAQEDTLNILRQYPAFANATHTGLNGRPLINEIGPRAPASDKMDGLVSLVQYLVQQNTYLGSM